MCIISPSSSHCTFRTSVLIRTSAGYRRRGSHSFRLSGPAATGETSSRRCRNPSPGHWTNRTFVLICTLVEYEQTGSQSFRLSRSPRRVSMIDTSRPASRILTVLELLQDHPGITGPQLAERLDVSGRTVRRYITTLQDMGVPVEPTTGRLGGYALRAGFRLPPLMFSAEEALGLAVALLATRPTQDAELPTPVANA